MISEEMVDFYVTIKNASSGFQEIWRDSNPNSLASVLDYQPLETYWSEQRAQFMQINKIFVNGKTGTLSICELEILGGKLHMFTV